MAGRSHVRVLNVAEKPSVAKGISTILSRGGGGYTTRPGRSPYNRIFEFEYALRSQPCHMIFTSVTGHLMELDFEERYRKWHSCDPAELYTAPLKKFVPQDKLDIRRTLEEEARKCQWLVLWLDGDSEGENIAFEVIEVCTAVNRHITIWRALFSSVTERDIYTSVQDLRQPNKLLADSVDARQEIDLRIGASFTRFQTMLLKDAFVLDFAGDERNVVLSYGPCQFPTLGFVVERYWEIQSHEPEEFWKITCSHKSDEGTATFEWKRERLYDHSCAGIIYEMCVEEPTATVKNVCHKESLKYPPYPLSTLELQKRASRFLRMSSDHTMKVAEELYVSGFISYPRTETDSFSGNSDLKGIVREQIGHPTWGSYAQQLLDPERRLWRNPGNGGHDDKAHPPIHPTKFSAGESGWSRDHNRLYELVVRHFLACVSQPAVGAGTTVDIDIAGEQFSASGRVIIERNYLDVYLYDSWDGSIIPTYVIGQQFLPTTLKLESGVTRPPSLLTEVELISSMAKAGIGTDATTADHIKKLLDRYYATKDSRSQFSPTNLGEALVMGYDDMGYELWKPYLRASMEEDMKKVSIGTKRKSDFLASCLQEVKQVFLDARRQKVNLLEAMELFFERSNRPVGDGQNAGEVVRPCNACHESHMVLKRRLNGDFMAGCLNFPHCRNVVWLPGAISEASVTTNVCSSCAPGPVFKIQLKFRRLEIPPNYDVDHLGCIGGCDSILKDLIEICGTGSRMATGMTARGQRAGETPNSTRRENPRQDTCAHCRQTGHSSNECPSQVFRSSSAQSSRVQQARNNIGQIPCESCGASCPERTATTEHNRGRKFYSCQNRECGFFVWEDDLATGGGRGRGRAAASRGGRSSRSSSSTASRGGRGGRGQRGGRSGGLAFVSATGEPVSGRCFICGDPSHFANACPNRLGR